MLRRPPDDADPGRRLMWAIRHGEVETASKMIDEVGLFYSTDWLGGYNLVCIALKNNQLDVAKVLLNKNSRVNHKRRESRQTPLHIAAKRSFTEIVEMLLNRGAWVDARNRLGKTPLHYAIANPKIVRLLLRRNASVYLKDNNGDTALYTAMVGGNIEVIANLSFHFTKSRKFSQPYLNSLLCRAARWFDERVAAILLRKTTEVDFTPEDEESPLHCAAKYGQHRMIKMLLGRGADINMPDRHGETVLHMAIQNTYRDLDDDFYGWTRGPNNRSYLSTVEEILLFRPDIMNEVNRDTLFKAITKHRDTVYYVPHCHMTPIVHALLQYGLTVRREDAEDSVFVFEAIKHRHCEVVDAVLKLGTDVNTMYSMRYGIIKKMTLLHMAVICYQYEIAEFLVSKGADVNIKDCDGFSPIRHAFAGGQPIMAKMLMASTSSAEVTEDCLCQAVRWLCPLLVEIIVQKYPQIDVNWLDAQGISPLHYAVINKRRPDISAAPILPTMMDINPLEDRLVIVKMLLSAGAYVDSKTTFGMTALHFAVTNGYAKVVEVLLKHGADVNYRVEQGSTLIPEAAESGNFRLTNGRTAVHAACEFGHEDVLQILDLYGCDVNTRDSYELTPLHISTFYDFPKCVEALLQFGANVNAKDKVGRTALHLAAFYARSDITNILLENGADTHARCKTLMLPINYAKIDESTHYEYSWETHMDIESVMVNPHYNYNINDWNVPRYVVRYGGTCQEAVGTNIHKYQLEAAKMMTQQIGDSGVTFHDILTCSMRRLFRYVRHKCIVRVITSGNYHSEFPLYCKIVERRFQAAQRRNMMSLPALASLTELTRNTFPEEVWEIVADYISIEDMKCLVSSLQCKCGSARCNETCYIDNRFWKCDDQEGTHLITLCRCPEHWPSTEFENCDGGEIREVQWGLAVRVCLQKRTNAPYHDSCLIKYRLDQ